jgi:hypothetical protein
MRNAGIAMLALIASPALAQETPPKAPPPATAPPCFDMTALSASQNPSERAIALMVNKCTGDTWYLGRTVTGNNVGYEWFPIPVSRR